MSSARYTRYLVVALVVRLDFFWGSFFDSPVIATPLTTSRA